MAKNKMGDVYNDMLGKPKSIKEKLEINTEDTKDSFIRVIYFISKAQKEKLKEYSQKIAPAHIRISQSELIRYLIVNMDLEEIQKNYFNLKQ